MLLVSAARSAVAWKRGAVAAAETYSAAVAATTSLQISSVLLLSCVLLGLGADAARKLASRATSPEPPFTTTNSRKRDSSERAGSVASFHLILRPAATLLR